MARKPIIAGNWKLHNNRAQSAELASKLAAAIGNYDLAEVVICRPSPALILPRKRFNKAASALALKTFTKRKKAHTPAKSPRKCSRKPA